MHDRAMHTTRRRSGITLVEVLVAALLLSGGALATLDATLRLQQLRSRALAQRDARLAVLDRSGERAITPCASVTAGGTRGRGHDARWTVTTSTVAAAVREVVQLDAGGTPLVAEQVVPCDP
jgi:Tfp pilus assembly protein PilV